MKKFIFSLMGLAVAASAFAIIPADPTDVSWYDSHKEDGFSRLNYTLPRVDTEGNELPDLRNLGFRVFTDNDQLFTFEASVYEDLPLDMTEIYYWIYAETGYDFNGDHTYFYRTNWEGYEQFFTWRIGIQAVYDDNGTKTYSNIVYHEVFPQPALPKPKTPKIDEWVDAQPTHIHPEDNFYMVSSLIGFTLGTDIMGNPVADDYPGWQGDEVITGECTYTKLDPEKVTFSIFTDNDKLFEFTSDRFSEEEDFGLVLPTTEIPFGYDGYGISEADLHFPQLTNNIQELLDNGFEVEPFFTWRIGIQTHYTDNGQRSSSDIWYMEIFPQLKPASEVTTTSFLADWSCDAENTYMLGNFLGGVNSGYYLHVIDKATQDTVLVELVEPTHPQTEINEQGETVGVENPIPGAFYTVEGLTPGATYEYYVIVRDNLNRSYQSVVREVTLPTSDVTHKPGDVNHDQVVDIDDVTALIAKVLGNDNGICTICANVNNDNQIDIDDVTAIINIVLGNN